MAKRKNAAKAAPEPTPIESHKHARDTRTNIPTREQGAMVAHDEATPKKVLYPRDPSLDPQLVWRGKDEQDQKPLEVPAVPIYIQEKIHSQTLIEDLRERAATPRRADATPLALFADFNGNGDPARRTEFYKHDKHWTNRLILGDSLLVMTSLAEKERLKGRVQMIYFDPPYGIRFGSNWQVSTRKRDVKDAKAEDLTRQPEQVKAFRDTWQLGIHSYLTYLRDRLTTARELLTDSGSIFVQIGDENVHLVRGLLDEVFGSENFVSLIAVKKLSGVESTYLPAICDFILWYGKDAEHTKYRRILVSKVSEEEGASRYDQLMLADGTVRPITAEARSGEEPIPVGSRRFQMDNIIGAEFRAETTVNFKFGGTVYHPGAGSHWKTSLDGMTRLGIAGRLLPTGGGTLRYVRYLDDFPARTVGNIWSDISGSIQSRTDPKIYVVQTSTALIQRCLLMTTDPGDLVLDPTCGSGTTAYVAEQWGRRWITIDTSRVALTLARTRLMAARFPYYLLADSPAGRKKEQEVRGQLSIVNGKEPRAASPLTIDNGPLTNPDIRKGFVYKRVPHVTLKSIANNPDITEGMTRAEIDAAIKKHAETETLYDQPYEDKSVVRVSGPFTVESLSPHRVLPAGDACVSRSQNPVQSQGPTAGDQVAARDAASAKRGSPSEFVAAILDNLRKAGVQNTKRGERLAFERLDIYPGEYLEAEGSYEEGGKSKRVAVCIGPEFGTVGPELLADAAREAHRGIGFDLLLVCGFAFDPHVAEEAQVIEKQIGKLKVLLVRMNPDLAMGDELLKKTGAGNLFMVFGEPDIDLKKRKDGKLTVEIKGVDVFDPTTGEIRSSGPDDIACWFIDTDYNGESFFVRHAYFLGGQEPYEKLKRALRAEIDEAEWSNLYSSKSIPFDPPKKGRIAVKVINHYGDEVLKVYAA